MRNPSASAARHLIGRGQEDPGRLARARAAADVTRSIASRNAGCVELAEDAHRVREVARADEQDVDAVDGGDLLDRLDRLGRLDLRDPEHALARVRHRVRIGAEARAAVKERDAAAAARSAARAAHASACSAELICGHITPSTPRSSARAVRARARRTRPAPARARRPRGAPSSCPSSCDSWPPPCSRSTSSQSNPASAERLGGQRRAEREEACRTASRPRPDGPSCSSSPAD